MFSRRIKKILFNTFLPRGKQYVHDEGINTLYGVSVTSKRKLQILHTNPPPQQDVNKVIILAHPYISLAKLFFHHSGHIQLYKSLGFEVITFDFNGFGQSSFLDFNFEKDILDVVEWASQNYKTNELILHGVSFGAAQIIKAGTFLKNYHTRFIIENCMDKGIHYFYKRKKKLYVLLRIVHFIIPRLQKKDDFTSVIRTCSSVSDFAFIYGDADNLTTPAMGFNLMEHCPVPYSNVILPGKHLEGIKEKERYLLFLQTFLGLKQTS